MRPLHYSVAKAAMPPIENPIENICHLSPGSASIRAVLECAPRGWGRWDSAATGNPGLANRFHFWPEKIFACIFLDVFGRSTEQLRVRDRPKSRADTDCILQLLFRWLVFVSSYSCVAWRICCTALYILGCHA